MQVALPQLKNRLFEYKAMLLRGTPGDEFLDIKLVDIADSLDVIHFYVFSIEPNPLPGSPLIIDECDYFESTDLVKVSRPDLEELSRYSQVVNGVFVAFDENYRPLIHVEIKDASVVRFLIDAALDQDTKARFVRSIEAIYPNLILEKLQ